MTIFVITLTEVLFTFAAICLSADFILRKVRYRIYYIALIAALAILSSIAITLTGWGGNLGKLVTSQPFASSFSSLYISDNFIIFLVLLISLITTIYSAFWLRDDSNVGPFYAMLLLLTCSLVGVASSGDFLTLFLFWEGMSLSSYGLVSFRKNLDVTLEASLKYFFIVGLGSLLALFGISIIYSYTGSLQLGSLANLPLQNPEVILGLSMIILGFGAEGAIAPLHTWLPDVYSASPTPVAAMISGAVTGMGIFGPLKVLQPIITSGGAGLPINFKLLIATIGLVTMLIGNLAGLYQTNLRRMLGYSSIAQTGYILTALSTFTPLGLVAAVFTIWNHGILKSNFFTLVGSVEEGYEGGELSGLRGIARKNKLLGPLFVLSSLGMVGSPPLGLFWSELLIVESLVAAGGFFIAFGASVALNIVISIGYYYKVINVVVFEDSGKEQFNSNIKQLSVSFALLTLSLITGLLPQLFLGLIT